MLQHQKDTYIKMHPREDRQSHQQMANGNDKVGPLVVTLLILLGLLYWTWTIFDGMFQQCRIVKQRTPILS